MSHDYKVIDSSKALQGGWTRFVDVKPFDMSWSHLIGTRNPKLITWVLNASTNSLVTPAMLKLWGYSGNDRCSLCEGQGSLPHLVKLPDCSPSRKVHLEA